jgi:hypothetical protein
LLVALMLVIFFLLIVFFDFIVLLKRRRVGRASPVGRAAAGRPRLADYLI